MFMVWHFKYYAVKNSRMSFEQYTKERDDNFLKDEESKLEEQTSAQISVEYNGLKL